MELWNAITDDKHSSPGDFGILVNTLYIATVHCEASDVILETLAIIPVMIIALYFHEAGHFLIHKINRYNPVIHHNSVQAFSDNFDNFKLDMATFVGVVAGLIPLVIYFSLVKLSMSRTIFIPFFISIIIWYFYGCRSDLKSFIKKEINEVIE